VFWIFFGANGSCFLFELSFVIPRIKGLDMHIVSLDTQREDSVGWI